MTLRVNVSAEAQATPTATSSAAVTPKTFRHTRQDTNEAVVETVHTTSHPWLTADHGWLPASFLSVGEPVVQLDGTTATVAAIHAVPGAGRCGT